MHHYTFFHKYTILNFVHILKKLAIIKYFYKIRNFVLIFWHDGKFWFVLSSKPNPNNKRSTFTFWSRNCKIWLISLICYYPNIKLSRFICSTKTFLIVSIRHSKLNIHHLDFPTLNNIFSSTTLSIMNSKFSFYSTCEHNLINKILPCLHIKWPWNMWNSFDWHVVDIFKKHEHVVNSTMHLTYFKRHNTLPSILPRVLLRLKWIDLLIVLGKDKCKRILPINLS